MPSSFRVKHKIFIALIGAAVFFILPGGVRAANYYASPQGGGIACSLSSPCALSVLNGKLQAGDIGYLQGGTYSEGKIYPVNSGSANNYITYAKYHSDTVYLSANNREGTYPGDAYGESALLHGKSYIIIDGINFLSNTGEWIDMNDANNCVIKNCSFTGSKAWSGIVAWQNNPSRNEFSDNNFFSSDCGQASFDNVCPGDFIALGGSYNVVQRNFFGNVAHVGISISDNEWADNNVIKNNIFENRWHTGLAIGRAASRNLIENNIFRYSGEEWQNNPDLTIINQMGSRLRHYGIQLLGGNDSIIRNNIGHNNGSFFIGTNPGFAYTANNNKIFNNTLDQHQQGLWLDGVTNEMKNNIIKNNQITRSNPAFASNQYSIRGYMSNHSWLQVINNNNVYGVNSEYKSSYGQIGYLQNIFSAEFQNNISMDPVYVNSDIHDYALQSTSPLIDAGAWLTTITSATGNGANFTVADAGYFTDGWGIVTGDTIKLQNDQERTITTVNYTTNQITVNSTVFWTQGLGVALDYEGTRPDIGAKEYGGSSNPPADTTPPAVPSGLVVR